MRSATRLTLILFAGALCSGCPLDLSWLPWLNPDTGGGSANQEFTNADAAGNGGPTRFGGVPVAFDDVAAGTDEGGGDGGAVEAPREVVEPDVIRRDGNLLYVLNQYRGLTIVDLDTETLLSQVPTLGYPRDLYLDGGRAYVLVGYAHNIFVENGVVRTNLASRIFVLDVSVPAAANVIATFDLAGDFVDSRLVGDVIYAVSAEFEWYYDGVGGGGVPVDTLTKQQSSDSWVTSVNIADPDAIAVVDTLSFSGYGDVIQATSSALFASASDWSTGRATITYIDISDPAGAISVRGSITVEGLIADRFKMDVWNGVLRVVSATSWPNRNVYVTTIDLSDPDALAVLGRTRIEGAAGETLFATRFDGPRGYVVTYLQVDPLFVLDLSDPAEPRVAGELIVPGWSTHIEPRGDRLIALGVDDTQGRRVSVSLYDVSDPAAPGLIDRATFGEGWSWSTAFDDVKAFTVLDDVLIVPFAGWDQATGLGFERLQFVSHTPDSLTPRGYVDLDGQILRSFAYGDLYYGVSTEQLAVIDAADLDAPVVTNRITLAEYVADFQELDGGIGVEFITRWDDGTTLLRTTDATGAVLGTVELATASIGDTHAYGSRVVVVGTGWDERSFYQVAVVDCTDPAAPIIETALRIDVDPYWGGACFDCYFAYPEGDVAFDLKSFAPWYPWWSPANISFITGDLLTLRCSATNYDVILGDATPYEGLAVIDLASGEWTQTIGLGFKRVVSLDVAGDKLYLGTREEAGTDANSLPLVSNHLAELDPAGPSLGPAVSVPGTFVQYDAVNGVLVVENIQYETDGLIVPMLDIWWGYGSVSRSLTSVLWDGGESVTTGGTVELPAYPQNLLGRGGRVYFDYYEEGYHARSVAVSDTGVLSLGDAVALGGAYAYLLDAQGDSAYFSVGGRAIAVYDFSGPPALTNVVEVMEAPLRMRFGAETAYAPLGYAGLARIPR